MVHGWCPKNSESVYLADHIELPNFCICCSSQHFPTHWQATCSRGKPEYKSIQKKILLCLPVFGNSPPDLRTLKKPRLQVVLIHRIQSPHFPPDILLTSSGNSVLELNSQPCTGQIWIRTIADQEKGIKPSPIAVFLHWNNLQSLFLCENLRVAHHCIQVSPIGQIPAPVDTSGQKNGAGGRINPTLHTVVPGNQASGGIKFQTWSSLNTSGWQDPWQSHDFEDFIISQLGGVFPLKSHYQVSRSHGHEHTINRPCPPTVVIGWHSIKIANRPGG